MAEHDPSLDTLEEVSNRLASEIVFSRSGSDEGLIPAFALLNDLVEAAGEEPVLMAAALEARAKIESYLDAASAYDDELLGYMRELVTWMPEWIQARRNGQPLPPRHPAEAEAVDQSPENSFMNSDDAERGETAENVDFAEERIVLHLEDNRELLAEFHAEAVDHLDQIEAALLALDDNPEDHDGINALFRSFHTLKGNAGFLQLVPMQRLCHEVETLLDLARSDRLRLNPTIITAILSSRDAVQTMLDQIYRALESGLEPDKTVPVGALIAEVSRLALGQDEHRDFGSVAASLATPVEVTAIPAPAAPAPVEPATSVSEGNRASPSIEAQASTLRQGSTVRVSTEKLDQLMDVVGELVIVQGQILASAAENGAEKDASVLERNINQLTRITKDLQHTAMALRMVPIKPTFQKMERLVRDLAQRMGRKVSMEVQGEGTEVDRTVVEEIADPLVHMIRNALDHGIEPEAERVAAGKAPLGKLALRAYHQGGSIIIELQDDGRGIDSEKVLKKARENGLVGPTEALTEAEILVLIFAPGFSTAAEITDVSGRGVGMDVVRRNIDRLRGSIEVQTEKAGARRFAFVYH